MPCPILYYEKVKAIRFETLEKICEALNCSVAELIEYQPEQISSLSQST